MCKRSPSYSYLPHGANNENLAGGAPVIRSPVWSRVGSTKSRVITASRFRPEITQPVITQSMVWQGTNELGCGISSGAQIEILVCRYNLPGNMIGQMPYGQGAAQAVGEEEQQLQLRKKVCGLLRLTTKVQAAPPDDGGGDDGGDGGGGDTSRDSGGGNEN